MTDLREHHYCGSLLEPIMQNSILKILRSPVTKELVQKFNQASPNSFDHKKTFSRMHFLTLCRTLQTVSKYKSDHLSLLKDMTDKWINTER